MQVHSAQTVSILVQVCSQNAILKLLAVTLATMPIVIVTGLTFAALTKRGIPSAMLTTFEVLNRLPGVLFPPPKAPHNLVTLIAPAQRSS